MMKRIATIILSLLLITVGVSARADHDGTPSRITHTWQGAPLSEVLRTISHEAKDYHISCIYDQLDSILVSVKVTNMTIPDAIAKITKGKPVKVKIKKQEIFVQYSKKHSKHKLTISSEVKDSRSHTNLADATVQLLTIDSILIAQVKAGGEFVLQDRTYTASDFSFEVPKVAANYILRVSHVGYQTAYVDVAISKVNRWEFKRSLPPIYLKEERYTLKEVSIVASKVMFYYKGDTLVYNADAFQLAEGSMLDALVKQLPGVELKEGGRIYHNGKFVQNLLLNGKDFFRGRQDLLLENLPSYTVKEVRVYNKTLNRGEFLSEHLGDDKEYVMDVMLKRQYNIGWIVNAEGGVGTNERYLARLFAIRHTDHSRFAVISNINNLNDNKEPGETENWKQADLSTEGQKSQKMVGIDYNIEERDQKWDLIGGADVKLTDLDLQRTTDRTNFLTSGDTNDHETNMNRNQSLYILSTNTLILRYKQKYESWIRQSLSYQKTDLQSAYHSATFSLSDSLINQQIRQGMTRGHELNTYLSANITRNNKSGCTSVGFEFRHIDKNDDRFDHFNIKYGNPKPGLLGNQYTKGHPNKITTASLVLLNMFDFTSHTSSWCKYTFSYKQQRKQSALYLLDRIDSAQALPFGTLPSELIYEQTMDFNNSYDSRTRSLEHLLHPSLHSKFETSKGKWNLRLSLPTIYLSQHLDYQRNRTDTSVVRKSLFIKQISSRANWRSNDNTQFFGLEYAINTEQPELLYFVNIHDDSDPMNIQEGNSDLQNTRKHSAKFVYRRNHVDKQTTYSMNLAYNYVENALAMGYLYDHSTGIRVWKPYNVNGNWNAKIEGQVDVPLDKAKKITFRSYTSLEDHQSIDIVNESRRQVNTIAIRQLFRLNWKIGEHSLGLKLDGTLRRSDSSQDGFTKIRCANFGNALTALVRLPLKMELSTDFTAYTRTGYTSDEMNGTDLVWNARLTCPLMKGRLLLALDGFDILGQLSNVTRTINAQSRTESYTNTLPRYALFHVIWRLNKKPKKKDGATP